MSVFSQAWLLMGYGLGAVFFALVLFYLMIVLLGRAFPPKDEEAGGGN